MKQEFPLLCQEGDLSIVDITFSLSSSVYIFERKMKALLKKRTTFIAKLLT